MTNRKGFSLAEVVLALFIFGFMSMSLATIYATANRHMFQNYRRNTISTNADFTMKLLHNTLATATRLDSPAFGGAGNALAFASNVDHGRPNPDNPGCYPISASDDARWHYFCVAPDNLDGTFNSLYYHTGLLRAGNGAGTVPTTSCLSAAAATFGINGYPACGPGGGGTVTKLMQHIQPPDAPRSQAVFSRAAADGVREVPAVRITLRSVWRADARGFGASQRDIDFTLDSLVTVNRAAQ